MNKDSVKGKAKEAVGGAKVKAGRVIGDDDLKARGEAERIEGKAQGAVGKVKDAAHDVKDALHDAVKG